MNVLASKKLIAVCQSTNWDPSPAQLEPAVLEGADLFSPVMPNTETEIWPVLHYLLFKCRVKVATMCIQKSPYPIDFTTTDMQCHFTVLHWACEDLISDDGTREVLQCIVDRVSREGSQDLIDVLATDPLGRSVLDCAADNQKLSLVWGLMKRLPGFTSRLQPFALRKVWRWDWKALGPEAQRRFTVSPMMIIDADKFTGKLIKLSQAADPDVEEVKACVASGADVMGADFFVMKKFITTGNVECVRACLTTRRGIDFTQTESVFKQTIMHIAIPLAQRNPPQESLRGGGNRSSNSSRHQSHERSSSSSSRPNALQAAGGNDTSRSSTHHRSRSGHGGCDTGSTKPQEHSEWSPRGLHSSQKGEAEDGQDEDDPLQRLCASYAKNEAEKTTGNADHNGGDAVSMGTDLNDRYGSNRNPVVWNDHVAILHLLLDRMFLYPRPGDRMMEWDQVDDDEHDILSLAALYGNLSVVWPILKARNIPYYRREARRVIPICNVVYQEDWDELSFEDKERFDLKKRIQERRRQMGRLPEKKKHGSTSSQRRPSPQSGGRSGSHGSHSRHSSRSGVDSDHPKRKSGTTEEERFTFPL